MGAQGQYYDFCIWLDAKYVVNGCQDIATQFPCCYGCYRVAMHPLRTDSRLFKNPDLQVSDILVNDYRY